MVVLELLLLRLLDSDTATAVTSAAAAPTATTVVVTPAAAAAAPAPAAPPPAPVPAAPAASSAAMALAETASSAAKTNALFFILSSFLLTQLKHNTERIPPAIPSITQRRHRLNLQFRLPEYYQSLIDYLRPDQALVLSP
uniref:Uncharacterized protein n=1 Tax=Aeromonas caviae TaxID=648 RepID=A0A7U6BAB1_AERCA